MPQETAVLGYRREFSVKEFERMSLGLIPQEMEDKWFIYLEGTTLHFHRSWTGICIYQVEFKQDAGKYAVLRALVNRDQTQNQWTEDTYDLELLNFLISNLLLGRQVEFPVPRGLPKESPKGLFQHHISGTAYPEKSVEAKPWWKVW
jgi:hypothetical protein